MLARTMNNSGGSHRRTTERTGLAFDKVIKVAARLEREVLAVGQLLTKTGKTRLISSEK
jgi:hypothetical protein